MNNNVVENILASIIFAILSTVLALLLQALGLNVQASVLAALFVLLLLLILYFTAKNFYQKTSTWITEFASQERCEQHLREAFHSAKKVKILTIRGEKYFSGSRSLFYNLYLDKRTKNFRVQVLVLSPKSSHITPDLAQDMGHPSAEEIKKSMEIVLDILTDFAKQNKKFEVRCYDETPNFKLLLFDDVMFVSAFTEPKNDQNAKMLRITREGTPLFSGLEKHFDDLWKRSALIEL